MPKSPTLLMVEWIDTVTHLGWQREPQKLPPMLICSIGFLVNEDEKCLRIASTWTADNAFAVITVIPKSLIATRKRIRWQ